MNKPDSEFERAAPSCAIHDVAIETQRFIHYPPKLYKPWLRQFELPVCSLRNAIITPIRQLDESERLGPFTGAVYDASGELISHSQRQIVHGSQPVNPQYDVAREARRLPGRTVFCGIVFRHFGHSLIETTSRLWAISELRQPADRFVFQVWGKAQQAELKRPHLRFMFRALGIDPDRCEMISDGPVICDELVVPASTLVVNGYAHPRFIEIYDRIVRACGVSPGALPRVYLSRRALPDRRRSADNEHEIEELVTCRGFTVVHPQELPFETQVSIMQGAEIVAGTDGSQMHMVAFARPTARVLVFDSRISANQYAVEAARGVQSVHVMANAGRFTGREHRSWTADLDRVRDGLRLIDNEA